MSVCSVCFCEIGDGEAVVLRCGHEFHGQCIMDCVTNCSEASCMKCPSCRSYMNVDTHTSESETISLGECFELARKGIKRNGDMNKSLLKMVETHDKWESKYTYLLGELKKKKKKLQHLYRKFQKTHKEEFMIICDAKKKLRDCYRNWERSEKRIVCKVTD